MSGLGAFSGVWSQGLFGLQSVAQLCLSTFVLVTHSVSSCHEPVVMKRFLVPCLGEIHRARVAPTYRQYTNKRPLKKRHHPPEKGPKKRPQKSLKKGKGQTQFSQKKTPPKRKGPKKETKKGKKGPPPQQGLKERAQQQKRKAPKKGPPPKKKQKGEKWEKRGQQEKGPKEGPHPKKTSLNLWSEKISANSQSPSFPPNSPPRK